MLANRVREYTVTTGTGDIALGGAMAGHIRFGDAFAVGEAVIYVIEDGDNYEIGTGTYGALNALARTSVSETLQAGVLTRTGALPITLSGQARIYCAATAEFLLSPTEAADIITEVTPAAGVTVDGVLLKDGSISAASATFAGKIGVGLAPITRKLEVTESSGTTTVAALLNTGSLSSQIAFKGSTGVNDYDVRVGAIAADIFGIFTNNLEAVRWDASQNATFSGTITTKAVGTASAAISLDNNGTLGHQYDIGSASTGYGNAGAFYIYDVTAGAERFSINNAGTATFTGQVVGSEHVAALKGTAAKGSITSSVGGKVTFIDVDGTGNHRVGAYDYDLGAWQDLYLSDGSLRLNPITKAATFAGLVASNSVTAPLTTGGDNSGVAFKIASSGVTASNGLVFGGIGWTPAGSGAGSNMRAGIAAVQQSADNDVIGLQFYVHPSQISSDPMELALTLNADKSATFAGDVTISKVTPNLLLAGTGITKAGIQFNTNSILRWDVNTPSGSADLVFDNQVVEALRLTATTGDATFAGNIIVSNGDIRRGINTDLMSVSGGTNDASGANIQLYGNTHATRAYDIDFRSGTAIRLAWENSNGYWNFVGHPITGVPLITRGSSNQSLQIGGGGVTIDNGANITLYANAHATQANDMVFKTDAVTRLQWDNSSNHWSFESSILTNVGDINMSGDEIKRTLPNDALFLSGGTTGSLGGNITLWGEGHATLAGDIRFRSSGSVALYYDNSLSTWDFQNKAIATTGKVTSATLKLTGNLSVSLTGTVSVTLGTNIVTGVGTLFTTQLVVGAPISIAGEIFTVAVITSATSLTLNSNHTAGAAGVVALTDPTLLTVVNSDAVNALTIAANGNATFARDLNMGEVGTGLNLRAASNLGFRAGGVDVARVDPFNMTLAVNMNMAGYDIVGVGKLTVDGGANFKDLVSATQVDPTTHALRLFTYAGVEHMSIGNDSSNTYIQTWDSNPLVINGLGNAVEIGGATSITSKLTVDGGSKISVQNKVNGGSGHGIFFWDTDTTSYGLYLSTSGVGKSLSDGAACTSLDGRTFYHIRNRINYGTGNGFIWENYLEQCLMSLTADTGDLYIKGAIHLPNNSGFVWKDSFAVTRTGIVWDATDALVLYSGVDNAATMTLGADKSATFAGAATFNGVVDLTSKDMTGVHFLYSSVSNSLTGLSGGAAANIGANALFYGETHATNAKDILFRTDASTRLQWDQSANYWNFVGHSITGVPLITRGSSNQSLQIGGGGVTADNGANITLYANAHATQANDMVFKTDAVTRLQWDHSVLSWDFQGNAMAGVGNATMSGTDMSRAVDNSSFSFSGGTLGAGAVLTLTGGTHSTQPSEFIFKDAATRVLAYAANVWDFQANDLTTTGAVTVGKLSSGAPGALTIALGVITVTKRYHTVAGEAAAADDLATINGGSDGDELILKNVSNIAAVTVTTAGNILLDIAGSFIMNNASDRLYLQYDASISKWVEISRSNNT